MIQSSAKKSVVTEPKIGTPLISELEIQHRTAELARKIAENLGTDGLTIVSVLKGAFMFTADLVRRLTKLGAQIDLDFIRAKSYGNSTESSGEVTIEMDVTVPMQGKNVLLVDDIIDTGNTLQRLKEHLLEKGARQVETCVLLDKPSRRKVAFDPDYTGFEIPDYFVVGYGLDYTEKYRCLPYITHLTED